MFSHVRIQIHDYSTAPAANAKSVNSAFIMLDAAVTPYLPLRSGVSGNSDVTVVSDWLKQFLHLHISYMRINMIMSLKQL